MAKLKGCERRGRYYHCRVNPPSMFDRRSFRTKAVGRRGRKIVVGCPKTKYDAKRKRCKAGMLIQKKLVPV